MAASLISASGHGKPKLLDRVREVLRVEHYSLRTEESNVDWINRFCGSKPTAKPPAAVKGDPLKE
jgi:hypothetical protein